jgi:hypothetical protein
MLAAYNAETPEELRLASEIITFSFHALEALSQAAEAGLSQNKILRHRGSAVSLSRESHKSQRKLDQLQRARLTPAKTQPVETAAPSPTDPETEQAVALVEFAKQAIQAAGKNGDKNGGVTWTKAFQQRQAAKRMTENLKKNQAEHQARAAMAS